MSDNDIPLRARAEGGRTDLERPWCCVEPRCTVIHQLANRGNLSVPDPGDSFVCFGIMPREIRFEYDGDLHANDLRDCSYTPLKGMIANQSNGDDWMVLAAAYKTALDKLAEGDIGSKP